MLLKQKKIPMRMCLGCREMKPKKELIRIVKDKDGKVSLDTKGKSPGRGAYICPDASCFARVVKAKRIEKEFGVQAAAEIKPLIEEITGGDILPVMPAAQAPRPARKPEEDMNRNG